MDEMLMTARWVRWTGATTLLVLLLLGAYAVLRPFFVPIAWAVVLCSTTWPLYRRLRSRLGHRQVPAALLMTFLLLVAVVVPVLLTSLLLAQEVSNVSARLALMMQNPPEPPAWAKALPVIGPKVDVWVDRWRQDPQAMQDWLVDRGSSLRDVLLTTVGKVGRNLLKIFLTLLTAFFFYRYGEELLQQTRVVARRFTGEATTPWVRVVGATLKAVVYGLLLTAVAQGVLAGFGYYVTGVPAPVLLGAATCVLALVPFGAPFVWVPASLWLLANQRFLAGIVLLAWGGLVVSTIDNVLRPYFISGASRVPYLLVFFGVLGGIGAFGLIGVFLGPTLLSVLLVLWRKWASEVGTIPEAAFAEAKPDSETLKEKP